MADPHEVASSSGAKQEFQLKIISPSPEVGPLHFPTISTSCTIAQLKQKISDASETKIPLPGQQRLIYRGRVLAQEERTLREVFGQDTIDHSNEPLTVHLAFNPGAHQSHGSSSSTPRPRSQQTPPTEPTRTNSVENAPATQSNTIPNTTTNAPPQNQPLFGQPFQAQVPQTNPFPQMQQAFAIMNQQIAAQMAALGAPTPATVHNAAPAQLQGQHPLFQQNPQPPQAPELQSQPSLSQHNPDPPETHHQPHPRFPYTQASTNQPHARLGSHLQGTPQMTPQQAIQQHMAQQSSLRHHQQLGAAAANQGTVNTATPRSNSAPPPGLGNTNTVIRETYGPNGERHQSIVSSGTFQLNRSVQVPHPNLRLRGTSRPGMFTSGTFSANNEIPHQRENNRGPSGQPQLDLQLQLIQSHMLSMELAMNLGTVPPEAVQEQIQTLMQSVATIIDQQQYQQLESRRSLLFARANTMRRNLDAQLHRAAQQIVSRRTGQRSEESTVYVVSSFAGPQALLISPSGYYTAPWPVPSAPPAYPTGLPDPPIVNAPQNGAIRAQQAPINAIPLAQANPDGQLQMADAVQLFPNPQQPQPHPLPPGQQLAHQDGQAPNPARDVVRILIPLGGHLWLLVRLFGFVYFFTHGASWQRTILLSFVATLLFIAQTGLFQPLVQTLWVPIRRHAEALLPLAANEPPRRGDAPAENNRDAEGAQRRNREPTPQEAAERLLREREGQDGSFMRQGLRRIERAVALFVASLVPGVGERHIAAREAAEAARQQQEREREDRTRREEEERARREEEERTTREGEERARRVEDMITRSMDDTRRRTQGLEEGEDDIIEPGDTTGFESADEGAPT